MALFLALAAVLGVFLVGRSGNTREGDEIAALRKVTREHPDDAHAHFLLGWALGEQGHYADALEAAQTAVRLQPDSGRYHDAVARALMALNRPADAEPHAEAAARLTDTTAALWSALGIIAYHNQHLEKSRTAFERVLALDSGYFDRHPRERQTWDSVRARN